MDFLDSLIEAASAFAPSLAAAAPDFLASAEPANFVEAAAPAIDLASTAADAAPSVTATAVPSLLNAGSGDVGPAVANNATFDPGLVSEPSSAVNDPADVGSQWTPPSMSGAGAAKPPTAWESIQQIPGKWWQGVEATPERFGQYAAANPFKTLATGAGLGFAAYNAFNPPSAPSLPRPSFGPAAAPRSAVESAPAGGPPRSPIVRQGGFGVNQSGGLKRNPGGFGV